MTVFRKFRTTGSNRSSPNRSVLCMRLAEWRLSITSSSRTLANDAHNDSAKSWIWASPDATDRNIFSVWYLLRWANPGFDTDPSDEEPHAGGNGLGCQLRNRTFACRERNIGVHLPTVQGR